MCKFVVSCAYARPHKIRTTCTVFTLHLCLIYILHLQVIYELTQGEKQLIEDLSLVKKVSAEFNKFVFTMFMGVNLILTVLTGVL